MASPSKPSAISNSVFKVSQMKSKKKNFVQQKVEVFRASDPALSVFMWGINHTINDLCHVPVPVILLPDDFKANRKIKVSNHLFNKENLPRQFKFKEYCPQVFRNLRERFGMEDPNYQASLTHSCPIRHGDSQEEKLLLTSYDCSLTVKQLFSEDVEDMHNILSEYHQHIVTCHGITLLPQFLGMYRITVNSEDTYLIVMRNMFSHRLTIHRKYDLKVKDLPTLKDIDFRNNMQQIYISDEEKEKLLAKLNRDIEFLVRLKIIDYSLLLGIHDVERAEREEEEEYGDSLCDEEEEPESGVPAGPHAEGISDHMGVCKHLTHVHPCVDAYTIQSASGAPQREMYFMGLLTHYDTKKKAAHAAKTVKHGSVAETSALQPELYGKRFLEFIKNIIDY